MLKVTGSQICINSTKMFTLKRREEYTVTLGLFVLEDLNPLLWMSHYSGSHVTTAWCGLDIAIA